jgi:glutamine synthetase
VKISEVKNWVSENGIEFFLCSFVEMSGVPKAKIVPVTHLDDMAAGSAGFAGFAAGDIGQGPHDSDLIAIPDFDQMCIVPWRRNMAWVPSIIEVDGKSWPYCPRTIMQRQLARAKAMGYVFKTGIEPEFMLLRRTEHGGFAPADALDNLAKPCYDLRSLARSFDFVTTAIKHMQELGWDPYANDHEDANCQFEINWTYSDAATTADRHVFFRWMIKSLAEQAGLVATFMPKPFAHLTGNGCHFHTSLWDAKTDEPLFHDDKDSFGLSKLAYHFLGGLKAHARALTAITAPTVNSYKRLIKASPDSGATWAPVYITYGKSNRTQMIRIPAPGRLENRTVDGAINPYLATAAILAAGLDGIKRKLPAGKPNDRNLYEVPEAQLAAEGIDTLPQSLEEAVSALSKDEVLLEALGPKYGPYYLQVKRSEWKRYHTAVSDWETKNYLEVF